MIKHITSKDNKVIKQLTSLQKRSGRIKHALFIAEGKRICDEAFEWARDRIEYIVVSDSFYKENRYLPDEADLYIVPDDLFRKISDTDTPQGVLCVMKYNFSAPSSLSENVLILDGVSEPGNMGTILRTAEAMGFFDVYITKGSADVFSPKVVRSTMGAIFRLNIHFEDNYAFADNLKKGGYKIISTALRNSIDLEDTVINDKNALVIGNEANGVSDFLLNISDIITKINMPGNAESLNAAIAAGIVMYKFSQGGI